MRPRRAAPRRVAALAVAAALAFVACGAGGDGDDERALWAAAAASRAAGTAAMAASVTIADGTSIAGEGAADLVANRGRLALDLRAVKVGALELGKVDAVFAGARHYARNPAGFLPGVRPWIGADLAQLAKLAGLDDPALTPVERHGFLTTLDYLGGATGATVVGPETVRGTEATRYRARVDLAAAAEAAPAEARAAFERAAAGASGPVAVEAWLDGDGRVVRMEVSSGGGGTTTTLTLELFDFGARVDVMLPEPGQVGDLLDLVP